MTETDAGGETADAGTVPGADASGAADAAAPGLDAATPADVGPADLDASIADGAIANTDAGTAGADAATAGADAATAGADAATPGADAATAGPDAGPPPSLSIADVTLAEGNSASKTATFNVTLSAPATQSITVQYATADATATVAGGDYSATSGTLTFDLGDTSKTLSVTINGDTTDEPDETFTVTLANPTAGATLAKASATGTISNDDSPPTLSVNNVTTLEGNSGTTSAQFTVTLSAASGRVVTVAYATADGTGAGAATAGGSDYVATSGTLTFAPGELTKTVPVTINGDTLTEPDEIFNFILSAPTNASIVVGQGFGTGTITNDDSGLPTLTMAGPAASAEGNTGTKAFTFTLTLSAPSAQVVTVDYTTANGTAISGGTAGAGGADFAATAGTVTFPVGTTSRSFNVLVNGDVLDEPDETFDVNLSNAANAILGNAKATATITNDDSAPTITIADVGIDEGQAGVRGLVFTATLSGPSGKPITVNFATADGTGAAAAISGGAANTGGQDYVSTSGTVNFAAGTTAQTVTVIVNGDTLNEADETMSMSLSAPTNATLGTKSSATGTLRNDDPLPTVFIAPNVSQPEGNTGITPFVFGVQLRTANGAAVAPSGRTVTVNYQTADATATNASGDYVSSSGTLTFAPGQTLQAVSVSVNGDTVAEANETFTVGLASPSNAQLAATTTGTGTIQNDDGPAVRITINNVTVNEGNVGTSFATFTVTLSAAGAGPVTVDYATSNGSGAGGATAGTDYTASNGTLTFPPGTTTQTINVPIIGDTLDENDELFVVTLSNASAGSVIQTISGTGTILDDDPTPTVAINSPAAIAEGNTGTSTLTFTVTLSAASGRTASVNYATADGSATSGGVSAVGQNDYVPQSNTLTFAPGETTKSVAVVVNGDVTNEANETFTVTLSGATALIIGTATGTGTITNDDPIPTITIPDVTQAEGTGTVATPFVFNVTLSNPTDQTVTMNYLTQGGTATAFGAGTDYTFAAGTLTFNPGETSKPVTVNVTADAVLEPNETFNLNFSNATKATFGVKVSGVGTITNDD